MGICNCKDREQAIRAKAEVEVPGLDDDEGFPDEQNAKFLSESENKTPISRKFTKQFLKLKTTKTNHYLNNIGVSTEKLFIKGKTLKGMNNRLSYLENIETAYTTNKSLNFEGKKTKREDLIKKFSEKPTLSIKDAISNQELIYTVSNKDINDEEEQKLFEILKGHYLFSNFNNALLKLIIDDFDGFSIEEGTYVFREGEEGNCFFIIKSGKMEVSVEGRRIKVLQEGDCFGELALIQRCNRTTTLKAITDCEFYVMEGDIYRDLNQNIAKIKVGDVLTYLDTIPWLKTLDVNTKTTLARLTMLYSYVPEQPVLLASEKSEDKLIIVKQGALSLRKEKVEIKKYFEKEYFLEKFIFNITETRNYDIYSSDKTSLYIILKSSLEEALGMSYLNIILFSFFKSMLNRSKFFNNFFIESQYESLFQRFEVKFYKQGESPFRQNNHHNKKILFILEGSLVDKSRNDLIAYKGESFGEEIMNISQDLLGEIVARSYCLVIESTWESIRQLLKEASKNASIDIFKRINNFKKISIFKHLSESRLLEISHLMEEEKYNQGEYIFLENTKGDKFYMLNRGRVRVLQKSRFVREMEEGSCFGELSLLNEEKRTASIMALDKVQCYTLTKEKFFDLIDDNMMDYLKKKMCLEDPEIKLADLYYLSFIGKGKFGSVYLTHNTSYLYAVKVVAKKAAEKQKSLAKYLLSEKRIMLSLDHPFIAKLVKTLKNDTCCYFIMEFINGINMEDSLSSRKVKKNVYETKFYGACMLLMVDYLNSKSIAHRDIKPNNIMVDKNGYLKLIDFGTAKKISDFTHTVIGTPHFTAPEVLTGKGYSFSCDFWSVGVTMYYIFYGSLPYGSNAHDIMEIYKEILHKDVTFPESGCYDVNNFLQILLNKRINQRMCNLTQLKTQYLYKDFPWDDLIDFKVKPPYIPVNIREWSNNLRNLSHPFESFISDKTDNLQFLNEEATPSDFNQKWFEEF